MRLFTLADLLPTPEEVTIGTPGEEPSENDGSEGEEGGTEAIGEPAPQAAGVGGSDG
jgi:hypothetical protein